MTERRAPPPIAPPPIAPPPIPPRAPVPPGGPARDRTLFFVTIGAVVCVAILGVVLTVTLLGKDKKSAATPTTLAPAPTTIAPPPTTATRRTPPPTDAALKATARRLDNLLQSSAGTRPKLQDLIITPFDHCDISAEQAFSDIDDVIANRQMLVDTLGPMTSADPRGRELIRLLAVAMRFSLDSDIRYKSWIGSNVGFECPRDPGHAYRADGDRISQSSTQAKKDFLGQYLSIAAGYGLKSDWQFGDI